jgi:hypothetical protein
MNERIKQLMIQADYPAPELALRAHRLTELIIQECRDIIEQDMKLAHIQMIPLTLEKYANGRLKEKIREHFGVSND